MPLLLALTLCACEGEPLYDTEYPVFFEFDTKLHAASLITSLRENANCFLFVSSKLYGTTHTLTIESNSLQTETLRIETERENRLIGAMGAGNSLILGCQFGFDDYVYTAYDRQCPACLSNHGAAKYPLQWGETATTVACTTCHRSYNLLSGGSNDGIRLKTYHARYDKNTERFRITNQ